jgi:glyoxylase-like metal-dependent hydrolase (beta-lactamase superfamily II)
MTSPEFIALPAGVAVFERGWLSANNILLSGPDNTALVDSGYATHSAQTVALTQRALGARSLDLLLNTHLHSDHCGGNAALQAFYPQIRTLIPPGHATHVRDWDPVALTFVPTGQQCPRFAMDGVLEPGREVQLGRQKWQIRAAPGHDQHSVVLFEPENRVLISADALWHNGFGVVFRELEGEDAFQDVAATLDLIESLRPLVVIPGHGSVFNDVDQAIAAARRRLDGFVANPRKHATHAAKVLLKFKLLELQRIDEDQLMAWANQTPYFALVHDRWFADLGSSAWLHGLVVDLIRSGAARREGSFVLDA